MLQNSPKQVKKLESFTVFYCLCKALKSKEAGVFMLLLADDEDFYLMLCYVRSLFILFIHLFICTCMNNVVGGTTVWIYKYFHS